LDEIGRGTATYDGVSIAWSIAAFLHESPHRPKTLFATHYHELNELEEQFVRAKNYHITYQESGNKVIFLRKLAPGGSLHSFGIHVAQMAGMPPELLRMAEKKLAELEKSTQNTGSKKNPANSTGASNSPKLQLSIFEAENPQLTEWKAFLETIDIERLTPLEALVKLQEIKKKMG